MFLKPKQNLTEFLESVRACRSDVSYESKEGDYLNLKSELSQFLLMVMYVNEEIPRNGTIACKDPEDMVRLQNFLE